MLRIIPETKEIQINRGEPSYEIMTSYKSGIEMMIKHAAWASKTTYIIAEYAKTTD